MIRVYPSSLDQFQYYLNSQLSTRDFILRECRLEKKSDWAYMGSALHKFIELGGPKVVRVEGGREFRVRTNNRGRGPELIIEIPRPQISEFRMIKQIESNGEPVVISGIVDGMIGNRIMEWKGVKRMNLEKFMDSWQWRCYLSMDSRFSRVDYHVFKIRLYNGVKQYVIIDDHKKITVQRYQGMESELHGFINQYVEHLLHLEKQGLILRDGPPKRQGWKIGPEFSEWDKCNSNKR